MKKLYLSITLSVIFGLSNHSTAQSELWGLHPTGGDGSGVLYSIPTGSNATSSQYNFTGISGANPQYGKLLQASNGKLYGMTNLGGPNNVGVLFEYDTLSNAYVRKVDFLGANGANPKGTLMQAANGKIYGMTQLGGSSNNGVLFEYNPATGAYNVLVNFTGTLGGVGNFPGGNPMGGLVQPDPLSTKLYGVTRLGGANDKGVLFEFDYNTNTYTSKVDFDGNTGSLLGSNPYGQLIKAVSASSSSTTLFGLCSTGGANNVGTLYQYDYVLNVLTKLIDMQASTGSTPQGSLLLAANGRLYGTASLGGNNNAGVIFDYIISSNTYNKIYDFTNGAGTAGGSTNCDLMQAANGKLYGLSRLGGTTNAGVIFEFDVTNPASPVYTKKVDMSTANGSNPLGSLMQVSTGKLYGYSSAGGAVNGGVIFNYNINANTYAKRIDLNYTAGNNANGGLVMASNGKLYGLAASGGNSANSPGVIFEYDRTTGTYTKRIDFTGTIGSNPGSTPYGSMIQASNGKLYGLTSAGGTSNAGTIFSYDVLTGTHSKLIDLTGNAGINPGNGPYGSLVQFNGTGTANGKLYGMTKQGGSSNQGVIFEFDPSTNTYAKKIDMTLASVNGYSAFGSMVESSNKLYGMTQLGGTGGLGVIFEYDPNTNTYTKKVDFTGTSGGAQGGQPFGSMVRTATVGILYGMTKVGGANNQGVIFEYNVTTDTYTKKYDLSLANGGQPLGSLVLAANNKLYGVTNMGGANGAGALFEYDIATSTYTKKLDFSSSGGYFPTYTQLLEVCTQPLTPGAIAATASVCALSTTAQTFSIGPLANASSYTWTLPAGASILSAADGASISVNLSAVAVGNYTYGVAGINICGTGTMSTANLTVNALPTVSVNSGSVCAGSVFTIVPGGATTYSVQGNSFNVSPSGNTTYTVIGASVQGCVSSNTAVSSVTVNARPTIGVNSGTICAGSSFTMVPTGVTSTTVSGNTLTVSPSTSTFYTIVGSDGNGCVSVNTATAFVTVNAQPVISISNSTMCAGGNVTLSPSGAGVGGTYSSGVLNGAGPFVVSPSTSTTYVFTGTNSLGCASANSPTASVTVYTLPVIAVNSPTMCAGKSVTLTPTGAGTGGTYTIFVNSTLVANGTGPFISSPSSSVNYTVMGTSSLGCQASNLVTTAITVYTLPVISVNSGSICSGSVYTFMPTGALTYTMTGPVVGTTFTVSPSASISNTIAGTSAQGCVSAFPATANLTVYLAPTITAGSGTMCSGKSFTINPQGGVNYTIQPNNTITAVPVVVSPSSNTTYTISGASVYGCVSAAAATATVTVLALPVISAANGTICSGEVFTTTVNGASSYTYVNGTNTVTAVGSVTLNPSANTVYLVTGTSAQGCVSNPATSMSVTVNALPVVSITGSNSICEGDMTTLTANGASTYNWGSATTTVITVSPSVTTTYTVTGTDQNNCSNTASLAVTVNTLPVITAVNGAICPGNSYTIVPSGASTYTYSSGSDVVTPSSTTNYSITGTSVAGCISATPAVITVSVVNVLTVTASGNTLICAGESATLAANGASTYTWNPGLNTANTITVSPATNTTYTVVGGSGTCSDSETITVVVNTLPSVSAMADRSLVCQGESVTLNATGAVSYSWSTGGTGASILVTVTTATTYSVKGTDINNCATTTVITIAPDACLGMSQYSGTLWQYAVYPNPNAGEFTIETTSGVSLTIVDALGQVVVKQELREGRTPVTLNEQAKGIYFVRLKNGDSVKTIKVVKQ